MLGKTFRLFLVLLSFMALLVSSACNNSQPTPTPSAKETQATTDKPALKIAYSDWPGWVAWDIGVRKGFFEQEGVKVELLWFEYVPSMDAFAAGQVDAVTMTNGDALVTGSTGAKSKMILLNDYSNGNDMVVARPGINKMADLKGKKIGVELGFVDHLLVLQGLEKAGLTEKDVTLVNVATHQTPEVLASKDVDAIAAWQPNSGQALKAVAGSKPVFTSADVPGLIYDALAVSPTSLSERRADWLKVVKVWYKIVEWLKDPANKKEALEIMSARVKLTAAEYEPLMAGTYFLSLDEAISRLGSEKGFGTLIGSTSIADSFNVANGVYKSSLDVSEYIDTSLMNEVKTMGK